MSRSTNFFFFVIALVSLAILLHNGCVIGDSLPAKFHQTRNTTVPGEKIGAVRVETQNGAIVVRKGAGAQTTVVAELRAETQERLDQVRVIAERKEDGGLHVAVAWPGGSPRNNESCSFDVTVPSSSSMTANTSNGSIELVSLDGPARLETSNGAVHVTGHHGTVRVSTSNGAVVLQDVTGDADVTTSTGRVEATAVTGSVSAHTSNGSVKLVLSGAARGPIDIGTSNGAVDLTLSKSFAGRLSLSTTNGHLSYGTIPSVHEVSADRDHVSMAVGDNSASSTVSTTNGSIDLRFAD